MKFKYTSAYYKMKGDDDTTRHTLRTRLYVIYDEYNILLVRNTYVLVDWIFIHVSSNWENLPSHRPGPMPKALLTLTYYTQRLLFYYLSDKEIDAD